MLLTKKVIMCIHKLLYPFLAICVSSCAGFSAVIKPKYDPKPTINSYSSYVPRYAYNPKPKYLGIDNFTSEVIDINNDDIISKLCEQDTKKIVQEIEQEMAGTKRYYVILGMTYQEYFSIQPIILIDTIERKYKERVASVGKEKTTCGYTMQHVLDQAYLELILDATSNITDGYQLLGIGYTPTMKILDEAYSKRKKQLALVVGTDYNKRLQEALSKLDNAYKNIKSDVIFQEMEQEFYGSQRYHRILGMSDSEYTSIKRQPTNLIDTIEQKYKEKAACFDKKKTKYWCLTMDMLDTSYLVLILDTISNITDDYQLFGIDRNATLKNLDQAYTKRREQLYLSSIPSDILEKQRTKGCLKLDSAYKRIKINLKPSSNNSQQQGYEEKKKSEHQMLNEQIDSCISLSPAKKAIFKRINNANNIYEMLGIKIPAKESNTSTKQIEKQYRQIILQCHTDKNQGHEDIATEITKKINACYHNYK